MVKYYNTMVVFEEIPNEITLAINITNCPCHCKGCHSQFLWGDVGTELTFSELDSIIAKNKGITTVCFMGGDGNPSHINKLAEHVKNAQKLKVGWYSGYDSLSDKIELSNFDFIKIGHYDENCGGLDKKTTNQIFYIVNDEKLEDKTYMFWKKERD